MSLFDRDVLDEELKFKTVNVVTGERRTFRACLRDLEDTLFDISHDCCTGECGCTVEPDGVCPQGWPARSRAAGIA